MQLQDCDVSPLKELVKQQLRRIADQIQLSLDVLNDENHCLLSDFDEIREMFKQMESMAASFYLQCYLSSFSTKYLDLSIAVKHLSQNHHGALIVIKRDDSLDGVIHSGISLEASLTSTLLESIFYPGNPLHDGAVLIISDRIVSAANVLPVSNVTILDKKIGMRHRAAIGVTEQSDALVLVVSEESGNASFAYKGILHPLNIVEPIRQPIVVK
jgi:diadenylate cyclase